MAKLELITQEGVVKQKKYGLLDFLKPGRRGRIPLIILAGIFTLPLASCVIVMYMNNRIDEQQLAIGLGLSIMPTLFPYLWCRLDELGPNKREAYRRDKGFPNYE